MIIYRLAQAEGNEKSKDWVQLTVIVGNDSGGEMRQKVVRIPEAIFAEMARDMEHDKLPYMKIEE